MSLFELELLAKIEKLEAAFGDRCKIIEMQLADKQKLEAQNKKMREALEAIKEICDRDTKFETCTQQLIVEEVLREIEESK